MIIMIYIYIYMYKCKPQTDYKPREGEKRDCIPYVRSMPVKRERRIVARPGTRESSTERTDNFIHIHLYTYTYTYTYTYAYAYAHKSSHSFTCELAAFSLGPIGSQDLRAEASLRGKSEGEWMAPSSSSE